ELEQLIQDEGFTDIQLLQPETVNQLILSATGAEDSMTLVTDENLYRSQQTITQGYREITQGLEEELKEEGGLSKTLESLENSVSSQAVQEPDRATENLQQGNNQEQSGRQKGHETRQDHSQGVTGQVLYQNYTAQAQNQAVGQTGAMPTPTSAAYAEIPDPQQIMNQILDYMKVSVRPESTVLNMQLHPESLGTLHIQISAREGVMTAHITATSEAVKTVLENQMAVLRDNFAQQDIKVEAIEVTVETHQFEHNLEQGRQRGEEEQSRKPRRRRLDVSGLESDEELTESDQIIAEMMAANGNSVDYLA
ncbi:MAG: flagellar hook-length control protein FliK, partial [Acetatifactor sp.]|nr:flagellar hook-length control protein FliK [Acetatifactor sp.]